MKLVIKNIGQIVSGDISEPAIEGGTIVVRDQENESVG